MRGGPLAAATAIAVLGACSGGEGRAPATTGGGPATAAATGSTTVPATVAATPTAPATTGPVADAAGSVTLRIRTFTLPELRAGGTGLRALVRAASATVRVRRTGGGGGVAACPVGGPATPVDGAGCADLGPSSTVDLRFTGGVELHATGAEAEVEEVALTYVPTDRTTTLVTPARPAGACGARPCRITLTLTPGRPGPFTVRARPAGGRPRLVATASPSGRALATVEGGGFLSINATLEPGAEAVLVHQEQGPDAVAALAAEISWP